MQGKCDGKISLLRVWPRQMIDLSLIYILVEIWTCSHCCSTFQHTQQYQSRIQVATISYHHVHLSTVSCKENGSGIVVLSTERRLLYSMLFISCCFFDEGNSGNLIEYAEYANAANSRFGLSLANPRLPRNSRFNFPRQKGIKSQTFIINIHNIHIVYMCSIELMCIELTITGKR